MLLNKEDSLLLLVDVQEKLTPAVLNSEAFIVRCEWLLKLARKIGVPILVSEQYPQGLGSTLKQFHSYFDQQQCIDKVSFSCMGEPKYLERLERLNKKQLILIGIETHVCVLQTALEMKQAGFDVFVVVDAVSCRGEQNMKYGLKRMKSEGIHLVTSEMVFFEWLRKAGTPEFKQLSKEFF
ncbi:isochorismatase family protein [Fluoribacter gormanii]|uniref:Isochorismatase family n=1 Tax=Fluoribacter gormanii TaxID=464 RepID=A0A377GH86_9GAMM|nr:isochorismatase family protein [Fluoribacter gormanii]KTD02139.1 YcaC related amidohydrolase [Fluoribacter gormanii]MCW8444324.1 isochorismatase family protein [Fluoribacter gormanii]MCW8469515.1 isochorismatase family protein [Fluoribacter gormanii]SIR51078.1 Nicotinamidase-related amidase [Fluoribacter gormanii]STO24156.1 Isochorismatase family [Fluoribacter gormanii]